MGAFITTYSFLKKIINKEDSFTSILNKNLTSNKISSSEVQIIRDSLKSTVNKYYFLRFEVNSVLKELDLKIEEAEYNLLILAFAMFQYIKTLNKHDVLNYIKM